MTYISPEQRPEVYEKFREYSQSALNGVEVIRASMADTPLVKEVTLDTELAIQAIGEARTILGEEASDTLLNIYTISKVFYEFESQDDSKLFSLPLGVVYAHLTGDDELIAYINDAKVRVNTEELLASSTTNPLVSYISASLHNPDKRAIQQPLKLRQQLIEDMHAKQSILDINSAMQLKSLVLRDIIAAGVQYGELSSQAIATEFPGNESGELPTHTPSGQLVAFMHFLETHQARFLQNPEIFFKLYVSNSIKRPVSDDDLAGLYRNSPGLEAIVEHLTESLALHKHLNHEIERYGVSMVNPQLNMLGRDTTEGLKDNVHNAVAAMRLVLDSYKDELQTNPTEEAMLGALGAEKELNDFLSALPSRIDVATETGEELRPRQWVREHIGTPLLNAVMREVEQTERVQRSEQIEVINGFITKLQAGYQLSSRELRKLDADFKLSRIIEDNLYENGSGRSLFRQDESRLLASLILRKKLDYQQLRLDIQTLGNLHQKRIKLGSKESLPSLFKIVTALREMNEIGSLSGKSVLKPIVEFMNTLDGGVTSTERQPYIEPVPDVQNLPKKPFPPERRQRKDPDTTEELSEDEIDPDKMHEDVEREINRSQGGYVVEMERIEHFIDLFTRMKKDFGPLVKIYRSQHSSWHPMPYYVIELGGSIAIAESPIYGNASYIIRDTDWRDIIELSRGDAKALGAEPVRHPSEDAKVGSDYHTRKLYDLTVKPV